MKYHRFLFKSNMEGVMKILFEVVFFKNLGYYIFKKFKQLITDQKDECVQL